MFGIVSGTVKNLSVEGEVTASSAVGGIAGFNRSNIAVCENSGKVICTDGFAGGVVGYLLSGVLNNCTYSNKEGELHQRTKK